jgi:DNA-binding NarL/FixJ family response regulator
MKILLIDDHDVVRRGLKQLLADQFDQVAFGEARNAAEALQLAWQDKWNLVLLDLSLPGRNGVEVLREIHKARPRLPILVLSMFEESEYAVRTIRAGAAGYVCKRSVGQELVEAVKQVLAGSRYISPGLAQLLAEDLGKDSAQLPHATLSDREYEVMKLIAVGKSVKEIAGALALGEKTVFTYRTRMLEKMGLKSDVEVARYALKHELVA